MRQTAYWPADSLNALLASPSPTVAFPPLKQEGNLINTAIIRATQRTQRFIR